MSTFVFSTIMKTVFILGYMALLVIYPRRLKINSLKEELFLMAAGITGVTLYFLLENIALTYTFASNVGVLVATAPLFTAILAHFLLQGEKLHSRFVVGFIVAIMGISLITFNGSFVLKLNPFGDFLATSAAAVWAVYSVLMRKISEFGHNNIGCTRKVFMYGLVFMLPALFFIEHQMEFSRFARPANLFNILFLGLGSISLVLCLLELGCRDFRCGKNQLLYLRSTGGNCRGFRPDPPGTDHSDCRCRNPAHPGWPLYFRTKPKGGAGHSRAESQTRAIGGGCLRSGIIPNLRVTGTPNKIKEARYHETL